MTAVATLPQHARLSAVMTDLGQYVTAENVRLTLIGAAGTALVIVGLSVFSRNLNGLAAGGLAPLLGIYLAKRLSWPEPSLVRLAVTVGVGLVAGVGYERLRGSPAHRAVAPLVLMAACGGVWLAVPENGPILVIAGNIAGLLLCRHATTQGIGYGTCAAAAWATLVGAHPTGFSFIGGLLSLAPLAAIPIVAVAVRGRRWTISPWPWLVVGSAAVAVAAARWIGVAPDATWQRVTGVSASAVLVVIVTRRDL